MLGLKACNVIPGFVLFLVRVCGHAMEHVEVGTQFKLVFSCHVVCGAEADVRSVSKTLFPLSHLLLAAAVCFKIKKPEILRGYVFVFETESPKARGSPQVIM